MSTEHSFYCDQRGHVTTLAECEDLVEIAMEGSPCFECPVYQRELAEQADEQDVRDESLFEEDAHAMAASDAGDEALQQGPSGEVKEPPKPHTVGTCVVCGKDKWILGQGMCGSCHRKANPDKYKRSGRRKVKEPVEPQEPTMTPDEALDVIDTGDLIVELRDRLPEAVITITIGEGACQ